MGTPKPVTTKERLTALEVGQNNMNSDLTEIKKNHLPHIKKAIEKNADKIDALKMLIIGSLATGVITLVAVICSKILI